MRTKQLPSAVLAAAAIAAIPAAGCGRPVAEQSARADVSKPPSASAPAVARVNAARPARATVRRTTEQPGQIEAIESTPIYAKLGGYAGRVAVDIGDAVTAGQVLAELSVPEFDADLREKRAAIRQAEAGREQARAAVEVARAGVDSAQARVEQVRSGVRRSEADAARWRAEFARVDQLARERALSGTLLDETRSKLQAAEAGRDEVAAQVRSAEAALAESKAMQDKARADLDAAGSRIDVARFGAEQAEAMAGYARIVAPFDGIVTRRAVDTGHLTTPGAAGEPLFVVTRAGTVTITVGVPESDAPFVDAGDAATVRLQALEGGTFEGRVARTSWALDPATRTLRAEIDLPDAGRLLRPGLYAYAAIVAEEHKDALTIPATALASDAGKPYCVVVDGGRARRRGVKVGLADGKRTEILSGIGEADLVVEANAGSLADGQAVAVNPPPADPAAAGKK